MSLFSRILAPPSVSTGAERLVASLIVRYSPAQHHSQRSAGGTSRRKGVEALLSETAKLANEKKPGMIKRALLAHALQNAMLVTGYDIGFVREVVPAVLAELTRPSTDSKDT